MRSRDLVPTDGLPACPLPPAQVAARQPFDRVSGPGLRRLELEDIARVPCRVRRGSRHYRPVDDLPPDYKRFAGAYGPGLIDDHLIICTPGAAIGWTDLLDNNEMAQQSCRIWFGGVGDGPFDRA